MKLPKTFVPSNWSEKMLEAILKEEPEKKETRVKLSDKKYEYYCDICGKFAGSIEIVSEKPIQTDDYKSKVSCWPGLDPFKLDAKLDYEEVKLVTKSFMATITLRPNKEVLESIIRYLDRGDLKSVLKKFHGNNLAFYCPTCDNCYCENHWKSHSEHI